jgi:amino acid permease
MGNLHFEIIRVLAVASVFFYLMFSKAAKELKASGWVFIQTGFALILLGMLVDITDNFEELNKFVVIGNTVYESFLEKVVGYTVGFIFLAFGIWKWMPKIIEHKKLTEQKLEKAIDDVKVLSGLIPICSSCKNIRDDAGYWNQLESYIDEHSEARFSHGLCPDCSERMIKELKNLR